MSKILKALREVSVLELPAFEEPQEEALEEVREPENEVEPEEPPPPVVNIEELVEERVRERLSELEARVREEARREGYEKGFGEGKAEGFKKGYEEGKRKADEELSRLKKELEARYAKKLSQLDELISGLSKAVEEAVLNLDEEVLLIVKKLGEKLLFRAVEEEEELVLRVVREALKDVVEGAKVVVRVSPEDEAVLKERISEVVVKPLSSIEVVADSGVKKGGCLLETNFGLVDATVERRWQEAVRALEEAAQSEG